MLRRLLCLAILASALPLVSNAAEPAKFDEATREPYTGAPEKSRNGKSIAEMKKKVQESWDRIAFSKDGKAVEYIVTFSTDAGDFQVEMWPDVAPNHCRSFIALAQAGFYDGLIFHRVIPGFMIQGGCPLGSGSGGPGYCVKQEFNDKPHERGVLSMARAQPVDSAGSQFFVCVDAARFLDKNYTAFGKVLKGMEAVDRIVSADRDGRDRPLEPVTIKSAKVTLKAKAE
jgi:peptidyl-prolyl cis-trans isomerase B (cyclophilin B)